MAKIIGFINGRGPSEAGEPASQRRTFTLEEAKELFPVVRRVTKGAFEEVKQLTSRLSFCVEQSARVRLEEEIRDAFQGWQEKIHKLGCEAKGLWLVDFDSGDGYYCWHYPEPELSYFHGYLEGFHGRVRIH